MKLKNVPIYRTLVDTCTSRNSILTFSFHVEIDCG